MTDEINEVSPDCTQNIEEQQAQAALQEQKAEQTEAEKQAGVAKQTEGSEEQAAVEEAEPAEEAAAEENEAGEETKPSGEGCCYRLKVLHSNETNLCRYDECNLNNGDYVFMQSRYGKDMARVVGRVRDKQTIDDEEFADFIGKADEDDIKHYEKNQERAREAMRICKEKIEQHKLDMKLVSAHYLDDNTKVLFFFTAEARVDFRSLVKDLVSVFKMRIELRQIGVRDESRVLGGVAVCGRTYCCSGLTDRLRPVSIKMAKEQNLSLNSMKISGPCGRLLCCLSYEYDFYKEEKSKLPSEGIKVQFKKNYYRVSEVNILSKKISVTGPDGSYYYLPFDKFERSKQDGTWRLLGLETDEE